MSRTSRREFIAQSSRMLVAGATGAAALSGCGGGGGGGGALPEPIVSGGITPDELVSIRSTIAAFMRSTEYADSAIPGLSLAIARDENMVYTDSFGVANLSTVEPVTVSSLFRIASVTKPITATTICRLANAGMLSIDAHVFGPGMLLGNTYSPYASPTSPKNLVTSITVRNLLNHTGGGWYDQRVADPVFNYLKAKTPEELIAATLKAEPLTYEPGKTYGYSNLGYSILGRVIEAVTNKCYADAVAEWVFAPCGVSDMRLAANSTAQGEVSYYESGNVYKYPSVFIPRLDSFGGWIANPSDLVTILMRLDALPAVPDIMPLSSGVVSLNNMLTPPTTVTYNRDAQNTLDYYAMGWGTGERKSANAMPELWSHDGDLQGTSSYLQRDQDLEGHVYCWAIVTNTNIAKLANGDSPFLDLIKTIKELVASWN